MDSENNDANGKKSLLGEFMLAFAVAPEPVQEAIVVFGLKQMMPYHSHLIRPYPMLGHMTGLLSKQGVIKLPKEDIDDGSNVG